MVDGHFHPRPTRADGGMRPRCASNSRISYLGSICRRECLCQIGLYPGEARLPANRKKCGIRNKTWKYVQDFTDFVTALTGHRMHILKPPHRRNDKTRLSDQTTQARAVLEQAARVIAKLFDIGLQGRKVLANTADCNEDRIANSICGTNC